jgi:hypothetical protein
LPTSQWIGIDGDEALAVWVGAYGRDHPHEGAVLFARYDAATAHLREVHLMPFSFAGPLHIEGVVAYGRLRLRDDSGKRYTLDATRAGVLDLRRT